MRKWLLILLVLFMVGCTVPEEKQPTMEEFEIQFESNSGETFDLIKVLKDKIVDETILPVPVEVEGYTFNGWFIDEEFTTSAEGVKVVSNLTLYGSWSEILPKEEELALASIILPLTTSSDLVLPTKSGEFNLIWNTSNAEVMNAEGKIKRLTEDASVDLSVMIVTDDVYEKTFTIRVSKYPYENKFNEAISKIDFPETIDKNITLQTIFSDGIRGSWASSNSAIISQYGVVALTTKVEEITLTLTLSLDQQTKVVTFTVHTKARDLNEQEPEYFINQLSKKGTDVNAVIMTLEEIASFNQTVVNTSAANTIKLENHPETMTRAEVTAKINAYSNMSRYTVYDFETNKSLSTTEKNNIVANRNLDAIPNTVTLRYAISTTHTVLRSYPTHHYSDSKSIDRFQETGFSVGTPMIVYHTSLDQQWYYVRMFHYDGWVPANQVALCNREVFLGFENPANFIVVLDKFLNVDGELIRMGSRFPYVEKVGDQFKIEYPKRDANGMLQLEGVLLDSDVEVSDGYIPYTYTNLLKQAYKFVGTAYSWGDKIANGLDCSSTQAAIYAVFGFVMGRNTSNQRVTNIYSGTVSSLTNEKLKNYPVGTLLYTSSHVLMYIGVDDAGNCWLLHNTTSGNICKLQTLNSYGTSGISWTLGMYIG